MNTFQHFDWPIQKYLGGGPIFLGGSSYGNLTDDHAEKKKSKKSQKSYFHPQNTFLISKSYSEHVLSVEKCRRCVFEHQNTIWSKETTYF